MRHWGASVMTRAGQFARAGERKAKRIEGQWTHRHIEMMTSPAYRVLSLSAHLCLSRLEIENANHAATENGQLIVTYNQFEEYGVHRQAIAPALRELVALGLIEITEQGVAGNAEHRAPNRFRLTYHAVGPLKP